MNRDNLFFTACGLALGLIIGSFLIGPKLANSRVAGRDAVAAEGIGVASADAAPGGAEAAVNAMPGSPMAGANAPMAAVLQRLNALKQQAAANPNDPDPLVQLGDMYMDVAKYPQAIDYLEHALRLRNDPNVRTDLGICYKQSGQADKALAAFEQVEREQPAQWQATYNAALILAETHRYDLARARVATLEQMQPDNPDIAKLRAALDAAK
jgi:tetratricopeptide (TPR) repeat protein